MRPRASGHGHDLHPTRAQEEGAEQSDGTGAEDQRGLRVPGRQTALDQICLAQRFLDHRERLHQDADARRLWWDADDPADVLDDRFRHEPVQPGDAPLGVVEPLAHVGLTRGAGRAAIRAAHGCGHQLAWGEAGHIRTHRRDLTEHLVTKHERTCAGRRRAKRAVDRAVGAADSDLPHAHQHLAWTGLIPGDVGEMQTIGLPRVDGDGRLHTDRCCSHGSSSDESRRPAARRPDGQTARRLDG